MFDVERVRCDFPLLTQEVNGRPLVYLDNGATTQKPLRVVQAMEKVLWTDNANIHRGVHTLSRRSTEHYEAAKQSVRDFINAPLHEEIIFTSGATESLNLVANILCEGLFSEGDEIVVSELEHHSNLVSWQLAAKRYGQRVVKWPMREDGTLSLDDLRSVMTSRTRVVAVTQTSNTLGVVPDVEAVASVAHELGALVVLDGAQGVKHGRIDVQRMGCDFYAFSGHKIYGPTGIGVLWGRKSLLEKLPPWKGGGEMVGSVSFQGTTYADVPFRFEAGTMPYIQAVGLATALDYYTSLDVDCVVQYERELLFAAYEGLKGIDGLTVYGYHPDNAAILSFNIEGVHHFDVGTLLDKMGIAVRTGTHCTEPIMRHYGITGTVRASFAMYNTFDEVRLLVEGVRRASEMLRG